MSDVAAPALTSNEAKQRLRSGASRLLNAPLSKPYLDRPADFGSPHSDPESLGKSQAGQIIPLPALVRNPPILDIAEVIGDAAVSDITAAGQIVFHSAGDTGAGYHSELSEVVTQMAMDYSRPNPADQPAFFFLVGDVIYNTSYSGVENKAAMYPVQYYAPYSNYPGKIVAIPGNHDTNPQEDPHAIEAFEANFCAPLPTTNVGVAELLGSVKRYPISQPGVYYRLDAPFLQVIGLFTNGGEQEGVITGPIVGDDQYNFLVSTLEDVKNNRAGGRRALVIATHHPPFSGGGGHSGSTSMLADIDAACNAAGIWPDLLISGHAHNYQRFTRTLIVGGKSIQTPYIVAGCGGHGITPLKSTKSGDSVVTPLAGKDASAGQHSLKQYYDGFGYLYVTVTNRILIVDFIPSNAGSSQSLDSVTVDLGSQTIVDEAKPMVHPAPGQEHAKLAVAATKSLG